MRSLLALLALLPGTGFGARPFVTDDARIVDPGGYQIETFVKRQRASGEREFWFLPAMNPWQRVELTLGGSWVDGAPSGDSRTTIAQAKTLLKPLETNGAGFALALGAAQVSPSQATRVANPYFNVIGSFSLADDRVIVHANLGGINDKMVGTSRGSWGVGAEVLLRSPHWTGIVEAYGQRLEKPTLHAGLRIWLVPARLQVDATIGRQHASPAEQRFGTLGLRILW